MNKRVDVSIIMTVYNTEQYVEKAIKSVLNSDMINYELIIVNDCSTDNSLNILKKMQRKYKNIILIENSQNMGAGLSKNEGLKIARGKYIGFIDSDDYVDRNYFLNMFNLAGKEQSDIVVSDIVVVNNGQEKYNNIYENNVYFNRYVNNTTVLSKEVILGNWACASSCSKLFKSDILNGLSFSSKNSDDIMLSIPAIYKSNKISYCEGNKYYYVQRENSVTKSKQFKTYKENFECLASGVDYLFEKDKNLTKIFATNSFITNICISLRDISLKYFDNYLKIVKDFFSDITKLELITNNKYLHNSFVYGNPKFKRICYLISVSNYKLLKKEIYDDENLVLDRKKIDSNCGFTPLVSIVIPVYNGENYLEEAIESALNQTYKNIEIIVVNDGSTDNTDKIVQKYKDKIRYFKKENGGVASALNLAIEKMNGEYFSWLSHDDLYFEDKIEKQINFLSKQKDKDVVLFSNYILINDAGRKILKVSLNSKIFLKKPEYLLLRGCINGITLLIPKKAFNICGKFNTSLRCTQDYDLWHKMIKKIDFVFIDDYLSKTRIHSMQDTNMNPKAVSEGEELWSFMIEDVPDKRKKQLEGSVYNFYYKMAIHLKTSPYQKTLEMCIDKCKKINPKKYKKRPVDFTKKRSLLEKITYCLDNYGLAATIKIIIKNIIKR